MALDGTPLVEQLTALSAPWAALYSRSAPLEIGMTSLHVVTMLVAGGLAIGFDRGNLRSRRWDPSVRYHHLDELHAVHRIVVVMLAVCLASGVALFATDVKTYVVSVAFWIKMALIVLLLANALVLARSEGTLRTGAQGAAAAAWTTLRVTSVASAVLWSAIAVASVALALAK
jgi:hypothetical protein